LPQKARDVTKALKLKGFQEEAGKDHIYYYLLHGKKTTHIFTKISHNSSEIDDNLCSQMAKQLRLRNRQFDELIECSLTYDGYIGILVQANILKPLEKANPSS
jgi:hypothetical protein